MRSVFSPWGAKKRGEKGLLIGRGDEKKGGGR